MSLRLRGTVYWLDVTINGVRHRESTGADSERVALAFEKNYIKMVHNGELTPSNAPKGFTLANAIDRMKKTDWAKAKSLSTHLTNIGIVEEIIGKDVLLKNINQKVVGDLKLELMTRYPQYATVNRKMAALQRILRVAAVEWGVLDAVPMFSKLTEDNMRERTLTATEEVDLFNELYKIEELSADYLKFLLYSGCRLSEPMTVNKADVDFVQGVFYVDHKTARFTGKRRPIVLNGVTEAILLKWCAVNVQPFLKLDRYHVARVFNRALKSAGLADSELVIHSLRHTFATRLVNDGVALYDVQKLLGHSDSKTTQRYAKLELGTLSSAVRRLDKKDLTPEVVT
jgi:integrase